MTAHPGPAPLTGWDGPDRGEAFWLRTADAVRIRVGLWPGARGTVLIAPGRTEYIEKYGLTVADLAEAGWGALVIDWRGQGLADRALPDPRAGHVGDFSEFQRDLDAVLDFARERSLGAMPWLAHSMGGCIALRALTGGARPPAVAFSAPMWGLNQPSARRVGIVALAALAGLSRREGGYLPTTGPGYGLPGMEFEGNPLTSDRAMFERMKRQIALDTGFALGGPSLRWGAAALRETAALARMPAPGVPALVGLGGAEQIVSAAAIRARVAAWPEAELIEYPGAGHELLMERADVRGDFLVRALDLFSRQG